MTKPLGVGSTGFPAEISDVVNVPAVANSGAVSAATAGAGAIQYISDALCPTRQGCLAVSDGTDNKIIPTRDLITGTPSYASVSSSQNNYSVGNSSDVFIDIGSNTVSITGFAATSNYHGRTFRLWFTATTGALTFAHESASSTDVNRIDCPGATNIFYFNQSGFADFVYDKQAASGVGRWRLISEGDRYLYFTNGLGAANLNTNQLTINAYSWSAVPSASTAGSGAIIFVSDVGQRGCYLKSDGTNWASAFRQTLHLLTVPSDYTGGTASQILSSFLVPAGFPHPNGVFVMTGVGGRSAGTANNASPQMRVGGNAIGTSTLIYSNGSTSMQVFQRYLIFQNSRTVQVVPSGGNTSYGVNGSLPTDLGYNFSTTDQYLSAGGALSNGADTLRLQFFSVEYM